MLCGSVPKCGRTRLRNGENTERKEMRKAVTLMVRNCSNLTEVSNMWLGCIILEVSPLANPLHAIGRAH